MEIAPFQTEHFFAEYEFNTPHQLCNSDCDTISIEELLSMADMSLAQMGQMMLGYTESQGNPHLRETLADAYPAAQPDDVIVLGTPIEGIYLAARAVLNPGDEVIVLNPAYDALVNMFEHVAGAENVTKFSLTPTETGWELDYDALEAQIGERTRLLVVNFPHNPTGYLPTPEQQRRLAAMVEANDLWVFYDEMYFGLVHAGTEPIPSMVDVTNRSIVLSGLSKTYGLPGLRAGWLIVQDEALRANIMNWKFYTSICPPAPTEFLAVAAWRVRDELRDRNIELIAQNVATAEAFFARWPDLFTFRKPMAGSMGLVEMHVPSVTELAHKLAREAGVLIQPATTLGWNDQTMRMGFGRKAFPEALGHFETYLKANY